MTHMIVLNVCIDKFLPNYLQTVKKVRDGWRNFSGKWYYFSYDLKNWTESRNYCITLGGDMAIVKSMEINVSKEQ